MSTSWRQALACKCARVSVPELEGLMRCGGFACQCGQTVATSLGVERLENQRDRLRLVTTEVPLTRRAHAKMLRRHAKLNTFVRCPACGQRGGMWYLYAPTASEARWCYQCGYKD